MNEDAMGWACSTHWRDNKVCKILLSENLKGTEHSEDIGKDERIIVEWILRKQAGKVLIRWIWLRIGASGMLQLSW
jgi:hypothetical protein